ncbi:MAG: hypothetical protein AB7R40_26070 [Nitrospiraceae bacterium]
MNVKVSLLATALAFLPVTGLEARRSTSQINYFYANANQVAVLDTSTMRLSLGHEVMGVETCSTSTAAPCFSIPYLSIDVAFSEEGAAAGHWRSGERLFCIRQAIAVSGDETVYLVESGRGSADCEKQASESAFLFSDQRGLLAFSKKGTQGRIVFTLIDPTGFGAR